MMGIYYNDDILLTNLIDEAVSRPDVISIKNRNLAGQWHIQTIGEGAKILYVKANLTLEQKDIIDMLKRTAGEFKVIFDGRFYVGLIDEDPGYDRIKTASGPMFETTFLLLVNEEGDA